MTTAITRVSSRTRREQQAQWPREGQHLREEGFGVLLHGSVQTIVFRKTGNPTGTFQTEIVELDLIGGGIMVRESPTLQSLGQTSIADLGGGMFKIDSFFDIFTEISLNDGENWTASTDSERVELQAVPEPASLALLAAGLVLVGWGKRRGPTG